MWKETVVTQLSYYRDICLEQPRGTLVRSPRFEPKMYRSVTIWTPFSDEYKNSNQYNNGNNNKYKHTMLIIALIPSQSQWELTGREGKSKGKVR
jgi:hypothetical protein